MKTAAQSLDRATLTGLIFRENDLREFYQLAIASMTTKDDNSLGYQAYRYRNGQADLTAPRLWTDPLSRQFIMGMVDYGTITFI